LYGIAQDSAGGGIYAENAGIKSGLKCDLVLEIFIVQWLNLIKAKDLKC
jgi:hypothetical protein